MKKIICVVLMVALMLSGCCLRHEWQAATCETPATCTKCQETEGEALGHSWQDATCETAKTCSVCAKQEGEALGHQIFWEMAEDRESIDGICQNCQKEFNEALDWDKLAPCFIQGKWEAYGAPEGSYFVANSDGTVEFNRVDKILNMTWEYKYLSDGILGTNAVYNFSSDELTFDVVTVGMLGDVVMFPIDGDIWSMQKVQ